MKMFFLVALALWQVAQKQKEQEALDARLAVLEKSVFPAGVPVPLAQVWGDFQNLSRILPWT
jgi:hypothetical protein